MASNHTTGQRRERFKAWLLEGEEKPATDLESLEPAKAPEHHKHKKHSWWQVMCLTGVDYFSTLGYQPGIAALAAGALSPIATLVLVLVTLFGALPVYSRVAAESPHGQGSIAMLERLLGFWPGKFFVLALLGFAATDFIITITLSAADATAHVIENPYVRPFVEGQQVLITIVLIALLGLVFLKGFKEAVGIAVVLVIVYLTLNVAVIGRGILEVIHQPSDFQNWMLALNNRSSNPFLVIGFALLLFPKLALGLSGFETGVAVMPTVRGNPGDNEEHPKGRIQNTKRLLAAAALIMSVFLITSSLVTTLHIPHDEFLPAVSNSVIVNPKELEQGKASIELKLGENNTEIEYALPAVKLEMDKPTKLFITADQQKFEVTATIKQDGNDVMLEVEKHKGEANGRALAYLAHEFYGDAFGTIYDISTILILWFAGASAMAALLNLVPRYLPRYGMAPEWARVSRPLTLLFTLIAFLVTIVFKADVDAQGGAYATGVLVLISSAAVAVFLSARALGQRAAMIGFFIISLVFAYTTIVNVIERPDGLRIALLFIAAIVFVSILSRVTRSFELRITEIRLDESAEAFISENVHHSGELHIIANKRQAGDWGEYQDKELAEREDHHIDEKSPVLFFEVEISDASEFVGKLQVRGVEIEGPSGQKYHVLRATAPAVPNAIAAFLLYVRNRSSLIPHCYFTWSEVTPLANVSRFLFFGEGDTAPMTREIIRQNEPKPRRRPRVHVG